MLYIALILARTPCKKRDQIGMKRLHQNGMAEEQVLTAAQKDVVFF